MILNTNPNVIIIELADNGEFAGKNQVNPNDYVTVMSTGVPYGVADIEFDSQLNVPIPEPATLLLLSTGALGVTGCIRRRRMR